MDTFSINGNNGYFKDNTGVYTFQIGEGMPAATTTEETINLNDVAGLQMPVLLTVGNNKILIKGTDNQLPDEIKVMFGTNRLLPELFDKQYRMLYGQGLHVYKKVFDKGKIHRQWMANETIENWLGDWQSHGLADGPEQYIEKVIKDNYEFEDYWTKWRFYKARRIGGMPVAGLEHIENRRCRLGSRKDLDIFTGDIEDRDFNHVVVGNWGVAFERNMKVYKRFRMHRATQFDTAISYHKHHTPGEIYGFNKFYLGIKEWLIGTNKNPQFINSFLEHALSAYKHVIIPYKWVEMIEAKLEDYCKKNQELEEAGKTLLKPNDIEIGTQYHIGLRDAYIKAEMRRFTQFMSGAKNQGKTWTTYSFETEHGTIEWKIEDVNTQYKDYIDALTKYDNRADEVITSAIGIDSSISNISKDGIISKSGADAYYNYIIYLHSNLPTAERICTEPINWAIKLNFPGIYKQGYRVGFYTDIPQRQEDIAPNDRLNSSLNQSTQAMNQRMDKTDATLQAILKKLDNGNN